MGFFKNIFSKLKQKLPVTNFDQNKSHKEIYDDLGAFTYEKESFILKYEDYSREIRWDEIETINVYKKDQIVYDRIDMEIYFLDKMIKISEDLPSWYQFVEKSKKELPKLDENWDFDIIQPPFAVNYTTIYQKKS